MDSPAKINLSNREQLIVMDKDFIMAKQHIISIVYKMFSMLATKLQSNITRSSFQLPLELVHAIPKIYKGENYRHLPYVIIDYPSVFTKEGIITLRTMFWWGNFFSATLHLNGLYKEKYGDLLIEKIKNTPGNLYYCINENEWEHHFKKNNYELLYKISAGDLKDLNARKSFIKTAVYFPLTDWKNMLYNLESVGWELIKLLSINFPLGEKDLSPDIPKADFDL